MILDELSDFAQDEDVSGTGSEVLPRVIDLGESRDIGVVGVGVLINVVAKTVLAGANATFELVSDSVNPPAGGATLHATTGALEIGGERTPPLKIPQEDPGNPYQRYLGLRINRGGTISAGVIDAFLTLDSHAHRTYPDAQN